MLPLPKIKAQVPPETKCHIKLPKISPGTSAYTGDLGWHTHKIHKHLYMYILYTYIHDIYIYISSLTISVILKKYD